VWQVNNWQNDNVSMSTCEFPKLKISTNSQNIDFFIVRNSPDSPPLVLKDRPYRSW
jgi:hypothetical protein